MLKTCPHCSARYRRLDRHLAARRGCGLAARAASMAAVTAGGSETAAPPSPGSSSVPDGLGRAGEALWRSVVGSFRLDQHELQVLESACRETDAAASADAAVEQAGAWLTTPTGHLKPHPGLAVARSSRLASARLLRSLTLPRET